MFCEKCGKPIPDGKTLCDFCDPTPQAPVLTVPTFQRAPMDLSGPAKKPAPQPEAYQSPAQTPLYEPPAEAPVYEPPVQVPTYHPPVQVPAYEPPVQPAPQPEQPAFTVNKPVRKQKPKKGKGGLIALAIVALVLVVGIVLSVIFWGSISRFFMRNLGQPAEYLQDVEKENVASVAADVAVAYDSALALCSSDGASVDTTVTLELSDTLVSLLQTTLAQNDVAMDLSWVENVVLTPQLDIYENTLRMDVGIGMNGTTVLTASIIWDTESQQIYIGIPELHDTYVQLDASELLGTEVDSVAEALVVSRTVMGAFAEAMPEGEQVEALIVKYMGIIIEGMSEAEKSAETVRVGSLEQDLMVVTVELSQKDILKIASDVLEEAQDDELIEEILNDFDDGMAELYGGPMGLYDTFSASADMLLDELDYMIDEAETGTFLTIDSYIDSKDVIVGRTFTVEYEDEEVSAHYITITEGEKWTFEAELDTVSVTGKGKIEDGTRSGSYTLTADGVDYITIEVEDLVCSEEAFTGTFRLIPESAVYQMMDVDSSVSGMLEQAALTLVFAEDSLSFGIEAAGTQMVAITLSAEASEPAQIALPDSFDYNNDDAGMKWLSEWDIDALLSNLEKAGVPAQYMDLAKQVADSFRSEFQ